MERDLTIVLWLVIYPVAKNRKTLHTLIELESEERQEGSEKQKKTSSKSGQEAVALYRPQYERVMFKATKMLSNTSEVWT